MAMLLACGCSMESETLKSITEVVGQSTGSGMVAAVGKSLADSSKNSSVNPGSTGAPSTSFQPKFPDRANPFQYPTDASETVAVPTRTSVADIRVMGFADVVTRNGENPDAANVAKRRVLLQTSVGIKSLAVGDRIGQIQVLRIDPPAVELKMGSLIWTATMFDR